MNNAEVDDEDPNNMYADVNEELRNAFAEFDRRNNQNADNNEEDDMNNAEVPEVPPVDIPDDETSSQRLERIRAYMSLEGSQNRMRPSIRRMTEIEPEQYALERLKLADKLESLQLSTFRSTPPSSMTPETMEKLLSSPLVKLTSTEINRARHENYPMFKDISDEMLRYSYLFDEIPFDVERDYNKQRLAGTYNVVYHNETCDWGQLQGWDVSSTREENNHKRGLIIIGSSESNPRCLEGYLLFLPTAEDYCSDSDEEGYSDDSDEEEYSDEGSYNGTDAEEESEEEEGESSSINDNEVEDNGGIEQDNNEDQSLSDESEVDEESDIEEVSVADNLLQYTFLHFNENSFVLNDVYEEASWYESGCDFGLITNPNTTERDNSTAVAEGRDDSLDSVTLFLAKENMAFCRGEKQKFISLSKTCNYGLECGSHYKYGYLNPPYQFDSNDESQRMNVLETMGAYRGSWISKLSTSSGISLPEGVVNLIWGYWKNGPPPYLFVEKGDLLLLARYKEEVIDPACPELVSTITREHMVLGRPDRD